LKRDKHPALFILEQSSWTTRLKAMNRFFRSLLFWTLILSSCSTSLPATDAAPLAPAMTTPRIPKIIETLQTPHIDQPPNGNEIIITPPSENCGGYQWAYKDMPEINEPFNEAVKIINQDAKAWATAFGEDCFYADGHADFIAMETDFYVHLPVVNLTDFEWFGNWIAQTLNIVNGLPVDLIVGPKPGFVEFWFIKSEGEHIATRVPIQKYRDEATGKNGEELFKLFYTNP